MKKNPLKSSLASASKLSTNTTSNPYKNSAIINDSCTSSTCCLLSVNKKLFAVESSCSSSSSKKNPKTYYRPKSTTDRKNPVPKKKKLKISKFLSTANIVVNPSPVSICLTDTRYQLIRRVSEKLGWKHVRPNDLWNIFWSDNLFDVKFCRQMKRFQRINHFPGMHEICRKDLLARNLNRMLKQFPNDYQIFPKTWCFPADSAAALKFEQRHRNCTYILKPDQGAQGRGIWLTKSLKNINLTERMICQVYINRPLLIDDFKFDLRIYTLITSIDPLRVYVYNEGFARFATRPYREPTTTNATNTFMHLTNYSLNRHSQTFCKDTEYGSKRNFSSLNRILSANNCDVIELWQKIDDIIIKTILSAWPMLRHNYHVSFPAHDICHACFEILGVDILIDENMRPWLLEVNHSPSFHCTESIDVDIKESLISDTFRMLNLERYDKRTIISEDRKRVNQRLRAKIKEIHDTSQHLPKQPTPVIETPSIEQSTESVAQPKWWTDQVIWEESNAGNFRRILPTTEENADKYSEFFQQPISGSIYSNTLSSKRRELLAEQQRAMLAKRKRYPPATQIPKSSSLIGLNPKELPVIKKNPRKLTYSVKGFHMNLISDAEERQRLCERSQREFMIKSCNITESLRESFYENNLLTPSDRLQYERDKGIETIVSGAGGDDGEHKMRLKFINNLKDL